MLAVQFARKLSSSSVCLHDQHLTSSVGPYLSVRASLCVRAPPFKKGRHVSSTQDTSQHPECRKRREHHKRAKGPEHRRRRKYREHRKCRWRSRSWEHCRFPVCLRY